MKVIVHAQQRFTLDFPFAVSYAAVRWGDQTYDEMMVGFFDVAVAANLDKNSYFKREK